MNNLLEVNGLTVAYGNDAPVVRDVSFSLRSGEVLGIVGESGSGKSTIALSLLGHFPWNARRAGEIWLAGEDMMRLSPDRIRALRGRRISYVPQNPTTALNPSRRIGSLFREFLSVHEGRLDRDEADRRATAALAAFGFGDPPAILRRYPHQLSGGQQQRVVLAIATLSSPEVVVLDEPTTGLDVSTQKTVLELLARLAGERRTAMIYITHDLSVLREIATHAGVVYAGHLVEIGRADLLFERPLHPYTRALLDSRTSLSEPFARRTGLRGTLKREELPAGCPFAPRCPLAVDGCRERPQRLEKVGDGRAVACHRWRETTSRGPLVVSVPSAPARPDPILEVADLSVSYRTGGMLSLFGSPPVRAVAGASLQVRRGEVLAIVGESGSGKSTLVKAVAGLIPASAGCVRLAGEDVAASVADRTAAQRRRLQLVFQNPDSSLNPRRRVGTILTDALKSFESVHPDEARQRIFQSLEEVRLPASYADRFPDQLSGGERQRVAIARALIVNPEVLICDEVLSALDVSVQAGILELLRGLCKSRHVAIVFVSHDLAVVRAIANRIAVLYRGEFVAFTDPDNLLTPPLHPYVHELLAALPGESVVWPLRAAGPLPVDPRPEGCVFVSRCAVRIDATCPVLPPPWRGATSRYRCHHDESRLAALLPASTGDDHETAERRNAATLPGGV